MNIIAKRYLEKNTGEIKYCQIINGSDLKCRNSNDINENQTQ